MYIVALQQKINKLDKEPFENRSIMHYRTAAYGNKIKRSIGGLIAKYSEQGELLSISFPCKDSFMNGFMQNENGQTIKLLNGFVCRFWKDVQTDRYVLMRESSR